MGPALIIITIMTEMTLIINVTTMGKFDYKTLFSIITHTHRYLKPPILDLKGDFKLRRHFLMRKITYFFKDNINHPNVLGYSHINMMMMMSMMMMKMMMMRSFALVVCVGLWRVARQQMMMAQR